MDTVGTLLRMGNVGSTAWSLVVHCMGTAGAINGYRWYTTTHGYRLYTAPLVPMAPLDTVGTRWYRWHHGHRWYTLHRWSPLVHCMPCMGTAGTINGYRWYTTTHGHRWCTAWAPLVIHCIGTVGTIYGYPIPSVHCIGTVSTLRWYTLARCIGTVGTLHGHR